METILDLLALAYGLHTRPPPCAPTPKAPASGENAALLSTALETAKLPRPAREQ